MSHDQFLVLLGLLVVIVATQQIHLQRDREPTELRIAVMITALLTQIAGAVVYLVGLFRWLG